MCCVSQASISRLGLLWGLLALTAVLIAFVSGSWVYTREPVTLPNSKVSGSIAFKIGLWKVCSTVKKVNSTINMPSTTCVMVKYSNWKEISDPGLWTNLDLAPIFISRMRSCAVLCATAVVLLLLAILCALIGHCNSDNKIIIGCGLFILGGLSLGTGLVIFVSSLSETLLEIAQYQKDPLSGPIYDYRYGWCFFTAGLAFLLTNMAAVFSISGYLRRFSSADEMVRQIVPGAQRKLMEHQYLSLQYLIRQKGTFSQYSHISDKKSEYEVEIGTLLNKTPPDVCTTNKCLEYSSHSLDQPFISNMVDTDYSTAKTLAGQTIPITIKNHTSSAPLSFSNLPIKYGTIQYNHSGTVQVGHQGFFGVPDFESSSSTSSSGYCGRSKTLQYTKNKKKCDLTFNPPLPETTFSDYGKRTNNDFSFSGSAV